MSLAAAAVTIAVSGFYQSVGNARMAIKLTLFRQIGVFVPMLVILPNFFGLDGMWIAFPVTDLVVLIVALWLLKHEQARLKEAGERS